MEHIISLLNHYGYWLSFLLVAIENIGIPFPIEFVYLYSQELYRSGQASFVFISAFLLLGHLTGACIAYYLGMVGNSFVVKRFKHNKALISAQSRIEKWYQKYGSATIFITRLVGYVRPWSSLIAGFGKENFWKFLGWTALGTVIFNTIALLFSSSILYFWENYPVARYIIGSGFIFFFAGAWLLIPWLSKRFKF